MNPEQLSVDEVFEYHAPNEGQVINLRSVRESAKQFALTLMQVCPSSADRSAALRKVREAVMTANASIVLGGKGL